MNEVLTIIGVGNEFRGDDSIGILLARRLKASPPTSVRIVEESGEGTALMEAMENRGTVLLIDAVQSGAKPGTLHWLDASIEPLQAGFLRCSTHNFSVHDAIEMARALGKLPRRVIVCGVEGACFDPGKPLSAELGSALDALTAKVIGKISKLRKDKDDARTIADG